MPQQFYPATMYYSDEDGLIGVVVPGINVNASASSPTAALKYASATLQDVIDDLTEAGEPIPEPLPFDEIDTEGAQLVWLSAIIPGKSKRINVTMDEDLIRRIDSASANRSAFLAEAAREKLAAD